MSTARGGQKNREKRGEGDSRGSVVGGVQRSAWVCKAGTTACVEGAPIRARSDQ